MCMTKVASMECLVVLVLWEANHILHKCFLGVTKVMNLLFNEYECNINLCCTL